MTASATMRPCQNDQRPADFASAGPQLLADNFFFTKALRFTNAFLPKKGWYGSFFAL
jgi:hypothetical protein